MSKEPLVIINGVVAGIVAAVAVISPDNSEQVTQLAAIIGTVAATLLARRKVTPTAKLPYLGEDDPNG